jgi:hypothetical protein
LTLLLPTIPETSGFLDSADAWLASSFVGRKTPLPVTFQEGFLSCRATFDASLYLFLGTYDEALGFLMAPLVQLRPVITLFLLFQLDVFGIIVIELAEE